MPGGWGRRVGWGNKLIDVSLKGREGEDLCVCAQRGGGGELIDVHLEGREGGWIIGCASDREGGWMDRGGPLPLRSASPTTGPARPLLHSAMHALACLVKALTYLPTHSPAPCSPYPGGRRETPVCCGAGLRRG